MTFRTQEPERQVWQLTPRAKQLQKLAKMKLKAEASFLMTLFFSGTGVFSARVAGVAATGSGEYD